MAPHRAARAPRGPSSSAPLADAPRPDGPAEALLRRLFGRMRVAPGLGERGCAGRCAGARSPPSRGTSPRRPRALPVRKEGYHPAVWRLITWWGSGPRSKATLLGPRPAQKPFRSMPEEREGSRRVDPEAQLVSIDSEHVQVLEPTSGVLARCLRGGRVDDLRSPLTASRRGRSLRLAAFREFSRRSRTSFRPPTPASSLPRHRHRARHRCP